MKADELHAHLSGYLAQNPANAEAEVVMRQVGSDAVYGIAGANDARGMTPGQHLLILLPNPAVGLPGVKELRVQ